MPFNTSVTTVTSSDGPRVHRNAGATIFLLAFGLLAASACNDETIPAGSDSTDLSDLGSDTAIASQDAEATVFGDRYEEVMQLLPLLSKDGSDGTSTKSVSPSTWIRGRVSFVSDFSDEGGQIPASGSTTGLPFLYVCAYETNGTGIDPIPGSGDDSLLGCDRADVYGHYHIATQALSVGQSATAHLVTWFCDDDDWGTTSPAEVCIRLNVSEPEEPYETPAMYKYVWSRSYPIEGGAGRVINWNLSCPNQDSGDPHRPGLMTCTGSGDGAIEPDETCLPSARWESDFGTLGSCLTAASCLHIGNTNSNFGWNKEFVHLYRAAIELTKSFSSQKPTVSTVFNGNVCTHDNCQDEMNIRVRGAKPWGACSRWGVNGSSNNATGFDRVIIGQGSELSPYAVLHEMGHLVHKRWLNYERPTDRLDHTNCADGWGYDAPPGSHWNEKANTDEGYADFVASASWFNDGMANPLWTDDSIEDSNDSTLVNTCVDAYGVGGTSCNCDYGYVQGEGRVAQFFWDLYDNPSVDDESVDLSFSDIRKVWSLFPRGDGDHENQERGPDGRNVRDYYHHYKHGPQQTHGWPSIWSGPMELNCVRWHKYWYAPNDRCSP